MLLSIVYWAARLRIYLALALSAGKIFEDMYSISSSTHVGESQVEVWTGEMCFGMERRSIGTPRFFGGFPSRYLGQFFYHFVVATIYFC